MSQSRTQPHDRPRQGCQPANPPHSERASTARPAARRGERQRGQALVELALMTSVFMLITMGVVDFGRSLGVAVAMTGAARDGATFAANYPSAASVPGAVATVVAQSGAPSGVTVTYQTTNVTLSPSGKQQTLAQVNLSYTFSPQSGYFIPFTIFRSAVMPQGGPH